MDLKIKDVAELLNVSETTIRRWLTDRKLQMPAYRFKNQYRFSLIEIEDWVLKHKLGQHANPQEENKPSAERESLLLTTGGVKQYSLFRAIHKGAILFDVPGNTKEDVIRNAMKRIARDLNLDAEIISDLLLDREKLQSTGLGNGIGLPHTRDYLLNTHNDLVVVVFPEKPIQYDSLDGKPVHTLFFLFACDDKRHLHLLAKIAHLSNLPETIEFLQKRPSKESLLEYVKNWESRIPKVQDEAAV